MKRQLTFSGILLVVSFLLGLLASLPLIVTGTPKTSYSHHNKLKAGTEAQRHRGTEAETQLAFNLLLDTVSKKIITLLFKKDICTLLDLFETAGPPKKRPFYLIPSAKDMQKRLKYNVSVRQYIGRVMELILVFHRCSLSPEHTLSYQISQLDTSDHFDMKIEINFIGPALVDTVIPGLSGKALTFYFNISIKCRQAGEWSILTLSRPHIIERRES